MITSRRLARLRFGTRIDRVTVMTLGEYRLHLRWRWSIGTKQEQDATASR